MTGIFRACASRAISGTSANRLPIQHALQVGNVHQKGIGQDVGICGQRARRQNGGGAIHPGIGDCQDGFAGPDIQRAQCQLQRVGAIGQRHAMRRAAVTGKFLLERLHFRAEYEPAAAQHPFDGRAQGRMDGLRVAVQVVDGFQHRHVIYLGVA